MNGRWQYKMVEFKPALMGGLKTGEWQAELDKLGAQGWELVSLVPTIPLNHLLAVLKREA